MSPHRAAFDAADAIMSAMDLGTKDAHPYSVSQHSRSGAPSATGSQPSVSHSGIDDLTHRLEKQSLMIQTLLMILLEKNVIQESEFKEWMVYVDELDGKRDGRLREDRSPVKCPSCGRNSPRAKSNCQYCGQEFPQEFLQHLPK